MKGFNQNEPEIELKLQKQKLQSYNGNSFYNIICTCITNSIWYIL